MTSEKSKKNQSESKPKTGGPYYPESYPDFLVEGRGVFLSRGVILHLAVKEIESESLNLKLNLPWEVVFYFLHEVCVKRQNNSPPPPSHGGVAR